MLHAGDSGVNRPEQLSTSAFWSFGGAGAEGSAEDAAQGLWDGELDGVFGEGEPGTLGGAAS